MDQLIAKLCRVIGAIVIVLGLYLVLWGKGKDQLSSDSDTNIKAAAAPSSGEQMATISETAGTSNQDFVLLDVSRVAPADGSVKENQNQIP